MRAIIILVLLVLLMALAGWVTYSEGPGRSSINIETDKIERDAKDAAESASDALETGANALRGEPVAQPEPTSPVSSTIPD